MELAGKAGSVWVVERGKEYQSGDFAELVEDIVGHIEYSRDHAEQSCGNPNALFDLKKKKYCTALVACGSGERSLCTAGGFS